MHDEATIHIVSESEPASTDAVHDAVAAAMAEAEDHEEIVEALEEIREEQDEWQQTTAAILSAQAAILSRLERMEASLSQSPIPPGAILVATPAASSETPEASFSRARAAIPEGEMPEAETETVEERVLDVKPEEPSPPGDEHQSRSEPRETRSFYSPLRNLLRARRRRAE